MYLFLVFLLFFFSFCIVYYMRKKDFLSFFFLLNIISFLLVNTCLFFFFYVRPSSQPSSSQPSSSQPASQPEQLEWYRSVPRRGASPVSSATPSTELRVIYLTWMVTFPAFSTSHGFKAKHFFFNLIFLSFSYLEHSIFQYLRTSRETARAVPLSIIATN